MRLGLWYWWKWIIETRAGGVKEGGEGRRVDQYKHKDLDPPREAGGGVLKYPQRLIIFHFVIGHSSLIEMLATAQIYIRVDPPGACSMQA